jgi:hypothetical protein|tara:strand:+ start:838 stop:1137 length:300 start_codon:yes stop_codon:yes gene_type:complete
MGDMSTPILWRHGQSRRPSKNRHLPWKDNYCNFEDTIGINFKNYTAKGTPYLFVRPQRHNHSEIRHRKAIAGLGERAAVGFWVCLDTIAQNVQSLEVTC